MKNKKLDSDLLNSVAESASNLADETNKAAKKVKKFHKAANKAKRVIEEVSVSEMLSTKCYRSRDGKLYRRLDGGKLENLDNGTWKEVKLSYEVLTNLKLRGC